MAEEPADAGIAAKPDFGLVAFLVQFGDLFRLFHLGSGVVEGEVDSGCPLLGCVGGYGDAVNRQSVVADGEAFELDDLSVEGVFDGDVFQ